MSERTVPSGGIRPAAVATFLAAALLAFALVAATAQAKRLSKADRAFVDATVEAAMQEEGQPGVSIRISGPRGDYTQTYGTRDLASGKPLRRSDHFRIGSITKTFTATAILREVDAGNLDLEDTLDQFVAGIPYGDEITVRDLLSMRSGIYEYGADQTFGEEFSADPLMEIEPDDLVEIIRRHEPYLPPDEATIYVNSNYVLLGLILEAVSGESAEAAITNLVIKPLKLRHTSFATTPDLPRPYSHGYNEGPGGELEDTTAFNPYVFWTAGAIVSNISDLEKYGRALGSGELLSPEIQEERLEVCPVPYTLGGPTAFGYGLGIISFGSWFGHDGSVPGFSTETFYEPQTGAVIAGMETLQTPPLSIFSRVYERIADYLYPGSMDTPEYPEC